MTGDPEIFRGSATIDRKTDIKINSLLKSMDLQQVTDLEAAVAYYGIPEHAAVLFPDRFDPNSTISPNEIYERIPPKWKDVPAKEVTFDIMNAIAQHHRLYWMDLTLADCDRIGIKVVRVYSPDLMSLAIPSFPEADHPRFDAYGGFRSAIPHPYP